MSLASTLLSRARAAAPRAGRPPRRIGLRGCQFRRRPSRSLRSELRDARWPADIVGVAERYVAAYPQGPAAATARAELERARNTKRLLERSDIRLYRFPRRSA